MKHGNPIIIIPQNSKPWPHELRVAKILCAAGYWIEFIPESDTAKTPDILLMKGLPDNKVYSALFAIKKRQPQINKIIFVTKKHEIIEIDK